MSGTGIEPNPPAGPPNPATATERSSLGAAGRSAYQLLRNRILEGRYQTTGRLPSERALAAELAIARNTLRQALARLAADGLVASNPQSGWQVRGAPLGEPPHTLISFTEMARRRGYQPRTAVLNQTARAASLEEADELALKPAAPVLELERVRSLADVPVCLDRNVVALDRAPGLAGADLTDRSLYDALVERGAEPHRSDFTVQACAATEREARLLGLTVGSPVLVGIELCATVTGKPLLLGRSTYRGDSYRFQATLFRRG